VYQVHNYLVSEVGVLVHNTYGDGDNIALGLKGDLSKFASKHEFKTYRDFTTGIDLDGIKAFIENPNNKLHFNLSGFSGIQYSRFDISKPVRHGDITN
jgi:hypothetical protein